MEKHTIEILNAPSDLKVSKVLYTVNHFTAKGKWDFLWLLSSWVEMTHFLDFVPLLAGSEFLIPITGYYCQLCEEFLGDPISGEQHVKGHQHNEKYKVGLCSSLWSFPTFCSNPFDVVKLRARKSP